MGQKLAVYDGSDARVEKVIKKLELTHQEFTILFKLFGKFDKSGEVILSFCII
jgi:hypothetical protein